jgi:outer membrane protein TolC
MNLAEIASRRLALMGELKQAVADIESAIAQAKRAEEALDRARTIHEAAKERYQALVHERAMLAKAASDAILASGEPDEIKAEAIG